jgi:hypothetical protein
MRAALLGSLLLSVGCSSGSSDHADGGPGSPDARPRFDADPAGGFDHFAFEIEPGSPLAERDFTVSVVAYSSPDQTTILDLDSTVSITASVGTLSGQVDRQPLDRGQASFGLQIDTPGQAITFTVTDDANPLITGTSPAVRVWPPGDQAEPLAVVINEVNWYGSGADTADEWIELYNRSGAAINLSEWTLEEAGSAIGVPVELDNGTIVPAGGYLLVAAKQGPDSPGQRTSLTGVAGVQIQPVSLGNTGERIRLVDPDGSVIDSTPAGPWPAGNNVRDYSMERRDDATGGGYGEGGAASSWYTWSSLDGDDSTSADTVDRGTPGASNTDPAIFDHFTIEVSPDPPRAGVDFELSVTAYRSSDDSQLITSYDGTISVTASAGNLTGEESGQPIDGGLASLTLQSSTASPSVTLTVTDDLYPDITGSITVEIRPVGDTAGLRDVVVNEVNWYGNGVDSDDEWIELRNLSGAELNLSGWTIAGAATGAGAYTIDNGTLLAAGAYLVIGELQGPDTPGNRTSLTGVADVQLGGLSLVNSGEPLILRDIDGNLIDETPVAPWPAGSSGDLTSMERRDELTGGGYGDGAQPGAWYTWNPADGDDTTHPDSADRGTPGAANTDPDAFVPPLSLPYGSGFEVGQPAWENDLPNGGFSNTPPPGIPARGGARVITTDSVTTLYTARRVQSVDCIALDNDSDPLALSIYARSTSNNGGNLLRGRLRVRWFTEQTCTTAHGTTPESGQNTGVTLPQGPYLELTTSPTPPAGASHFKIWFQVNDSNGAPNDGDDWAADDVSASQ